MCAGSPCVLATFFLPSLVGGGVMAVVFPIVSFRLNCNGCFLHLVDPYRVIDVNFTNLFESLLEEIICHWSRLPLSIFYFLCRYLTKYVTVLCSLCWSLLHLTRRQQSNTAWAERTWGFHIFLSSTFLTKSRKHHNFGIYISCLSTLG